VSAPAAELPAGTPADSAPNAASEQHPPPAAASAPASSDRAPKRERSGAQKRKQAKAKAGGAPARPSSGAVLDRELRALEDQLNGILAAPAAGMHMAGDVWAAEHWEAHTPPFVHQVVELARRNPAFRVQLQRALQVSETGQLIVAGATLLIPLLIYYGILPVPPPVRAQLKVPDRAEARGEAPVYMPGEAVPSADAPAAARFTESQPPGTAGAPPAPGPPAAG
jgi:hypothetical protein